MIQLYQYEVCPYCCKVKAVLDYKKIPYEKIEVNPTTHEEMAHLPEAVKHDKVPVLVDDGKVVVESNDIIRYLDEKYPQKPISGKTDGEKRDQESWIRFADDELVQILPGNIYRTFLESLDAFSYITKVGNFPIWKRYYLMLGGAVAMNIVAKKGLKKRGITDPRAALKSALGKWAQALEQKKFHGGDRPDIADLTIYGILSAVREMKVWKFIEEQRPVAEWFGRIRKAFS